MEFILLLRRNTLLYHELFKKTSKCNVYNNKQIFHALFNIKNYSSEVINIQRHKVEKNIILPRVNNFGIKKKAWSICFLVCHQHQARSRKIKANKRQ